MSLVCVVVAEIEIFVSCKTQLLGFTRRGRTFLFDIENKIILTKFRLMEQNLVLFLFALDCIIRSLLRLFGVSGKISVEQSCKKHYW